MKYRGWSNVDEVKAARIANDLELLIKQGFYPKGESIPTADQFGRMYGVGSHTSKRIRYLLEDKGLVSVTKRGTFVR